MNNREWGELLRYSSPDKIWVVTWQNKLLELKCPFNVLVVHNLGALKKGSMEQVSKVKISSSMITVFIIKNMPYYYHHFKIFISDE
jgi:hypothetical protein